MASANASIIQLDDGTRHRVLMQKQDIIDKTLTDPAVKIPLQWSLQRDGSDYAVDGMAEKWTYSSENWYDYLNISSAYLVERCRQRGMDDPEILEIINIWGNQMYDLYPAERARYPRETLSHIPSGYDKPAKYIKDLPIEIRDAMEEYMSTVEKDRELRTYKDCRLQSTNLRKVKSYERSLCQSLMCRGNNTVNNMDDLERILPNQDEDTKKKYLRCAELNEFCQVPGDRFPQVFPIINYTHLPNSGSGDCLFIAVSHYLALAGKLGAAMGYPDKLIFPSEDNLEQINVKIQPNIKGNREDKQHGIVLRKQTVEWLRHHPDSRTPQGMSVKDELALNYLENSPEIASRETHFRTLRDYFKQRDPGSDYFSDKKHIEDDKAYIRTILTESTDDGYEDILTFLMDKYLEAMSNIHTYAGGPEIMALANILNVNIFIVQKMENLLMYNFGAMVNSNDYMLIFHNRKVTARVGGDHYEIMFPTKLLGPKFKKPTPKPRKANPRELDIAMSILRTLTRSPVSAMHVDPSVINSALVDAAKTADMPSKIMVINTLMNKNLEVLIGTYYAPFRSIYLDFITSWLPLIPDEVKVKHIFNLLNWLASQYNMPTENSSGGYLRDRDKYLESILITAYESLESMSYIRGLSDNNLDFYTTLNLLLGKFHMKRGDYHDWSISARMDIINNNSKEKSDRDMLLSVYWKQVFSPHLVFMYKQYLLSDQQVEDIILPGVTVDKADLDTFIEAHVQLMERYIDPSSDNDSEISMAFTEEQYDIYEKILRVRPDLDGYITADMAQQIYDLGIDQSEEQLFKEIITDIVTKQ